jgi:hypothetical protein
MSDVTLQIIVELENQARAGAQQLLSDMGELSETASEADASLASLGDTTGSAADGLSEVGAAAGEAAGGLGDAGEAAGDAGTEFEDAGDQSKGAASGFGELQKGARQLGLALGAMQVARTAFALGELGLASFRSEAAFGAVTGAGKNAAAAIRDLQKATEGEVSQMQLQNWATQTMVAGLADGTDGLARMASAAAGLADVVGSDTLGAMTQLNNALATGSLRAIRAMGLSVQEVEAEIEKVTRAHKDWTEEAVRTEAVLNVAERTIARYGDTIPAMADSMDVARARFDDLKVSIGELLATGALVELPQWGNRWRQVAAGLGAWTLNAVGAKDAAIKLVDGMGMLEPPVRESGQYFAQIARESQAAATGIGDFGDAAAGATQPVATLDQQVSDLAVAVAQPIKIANEEYAAQLNDLRGKAGELRDKIRELESATYITGAQQEELAGLRDELGNTTQSMSDLAAAHEDQTRRFLYDMAIQRLAMDGWTEDEQTLALTMARDFGLIDQVSFNTAQAMNAALTGFADGAGINETMDKINGVYTLLANDVPAAVGILSGSLLGPLPAAFGATGQAIDQTGARATILREQFDGIPRQISTEILTPGLEAATSSVNEYVLALGSVPQFVSTVAQLSGGLNIPSYQSGVDDAPGGLAVLHPGEAVLPPGEAAAYRAGKSSMVNSNNRTQTIGPTTIIYNVSDQAGVIMAEQARRARRQEQLWGGQ